MTDLLEVFNDSYERLISLSENKNTFFESFYQNFTGRSADIASKFRDTDLKVQADEMRKSITFVVNFYIKPESNEYLDSIAQLHSKKGMDIKPQLYDEWLGALIDTLKQHYPQYNSKVKLAWRVILSPGIEFMKSHYENG